jgi:glycolate oxidase iron-sulfur subunit
VLEGAPVSASTQLHLDRCLGCRACESACPSGVKYGRLLDIGREVTEERVGRTPAAAAKRFLLNKIVPYQRRASALLRIANLARTVLPRRLRAELPALPAKLPAAARAWPAPRHARRVLLLEGCVQPALAAGINPAAARVLDQIGISVEAVPAGGCCGALSQHLGAAGDAQAQLKRNVDALWPGIAAGAEAVLMTSSACSATLMDYGRLLAADPDYAPRAERVSELARDLSQLLASEGAALRGALVRARAAGTATRVAFQAPCSLQHALKASGVIEPLLLAAGFSLTAVEDGQRCCGSAGTYSILQPELSQRLLASKLEALGRGAPEVIATANIGCLHHLRSATSIPVRHWVELLDERLRGA